MQKVILASGSARRKEILETLGVEFEIRESMFDEELVSSDDPVELAEELSLQKALAVSRQEPDAIIIGGDTVVELDGEMLGKPKDSVDAMRMMKLLSEREHRIVTGVAVVNSLTGERLVSSDTAYVKFRKLSILEIERYVATRAWSGFAAGYAIQGKAGSLVESYKGNISTIIGFPIALVSEMLSQMGVVVVGDPQELEKTLPNRKTGLEGTGND
jgi:septum formation protein